MKHPIPLILLLIIITYPAASAEYDIHDLIHLLQESPVEKTPKGYIESRDGILFLSGESMAAKVNNKAADLMKKGDYAEAEKILTGALKKDALFFPFRFNIGICYLYLNNLKMSLINFTKAQQVFPEYSRTYLRIGYIYQRWKMESKAISSFREALKRNRKELDTFILIGDIYFQRNQLELAKKYYETSLTIDPRFPNGLLGLAKVLYKKGKFIQSIVQLKTVKTDGKYDKALHFYYAEASFKLRDYKKAAEEYGKLLQFKNDKFFLTYSKELIKHKFDLSKRFTGE
jgi:tetratricopeptide (TPR) repeat protein